MNPLPVTVKVDPPTKEVVLPEDKVVEGKVKINSQGHD